MGKQIERKKVNKREYKISAALDFNRKTETHVFLNPTDPRGTEMPTPWALALARGSSSEMAGSSTFWLCHLLAL